MILLLGGTADTPRLAERLLACGATVLVSLATDTPLALPSHPRLHVRRGRLDVEACIALLRAEGVTLLLDASHPYAEDARCMAREAAQRCGIRYAAYIRPAAGTAIPDGLEWIEAASHEEAARQACEPREPILLTIGSRHMEVYVREARALGVPVFARILPGAEAEAACRAAGLGVESCIVGRGPFSHADTLALLRAHRIGVMVTKDGGEAGGLPEKLHAARDAGCRVILVARPKVPPDAWSSLDALLEAVEGWMRDGVLQAGG